MLVCRNLRGAYCAVFLCRPLHVQRVSMQNWRVPTSNLYASNGDRHLMRLTPTPIIMQPNLTIGEGSSAPADSKVNASSVVLAVSASSGSVRGPVNGSIASTSSGGNSAGIKPAADSKESELAADIAGGKMDGEMVRAGGLKGLRMKPAPKRKGSSSSDSDSDSDSSSSDSDAGSGGKAKGAAGEPAGMGYLMGNPKGQSKYVGLLRRPEGYEGTPAGGSFRLPTNNNAAAGGGTDAAKPASGDAAAAAGGQSDAAKLLQQGGADGQFQRTNALKGLRLLSEVEKQGKEKGHKSRNNNGGDHSHPAHSPSSSDHEGTAPAAATAAASPNGDIAGSDGESGVGSGDDIESGSGSEGISDDDDDGGVNDFLDEPDDDGHAHGEHKADGAHANHHHHNHHHHKPGVGHNAGSASSIVQPSLLGTAGGGSASTMQGLGSPQAGYAFRTGSLTNGSGGGGVMSAASSQANMNAASSIMGTAGSVGVINATGIQSRSASPSGSPNDAASPVVVLSGAAGLMATAGSVVSTGSGTVSSGPSAGGASTVPVSTAELFEADTFFVVDKEWEHLKTLKLVFQGAGLDEKQQDRFLAALKPGENTEYEQPNDTVFAGHAVSVQLISARLHRIHSHVCLPA